MTGARRLLAINNYYYRRGGAESVFLDQNDLFMAAGWDVVPGGADDPELTAGPGRDSGDVDLHLGSPGTS